MTSAQLRLIGLALVSLVLIVASGFAMDWFVAKTSSDVMGANRIGVDLRTIHVCTPLGICGGAPVGLGGGSYSTFASMTLLGALGLSAIVVVQVGRRMLGRDAFPMLIKVGYGAAIFVFANAILAGYLVNPGLGHQDVGFGLTLRVTRTVAPVLLLIACVTSAAVLYLASGKRGAVAHPLAEPNPAPASTPSEVFAGKLRFAASSMELSAVGIDARRESGPPILVPWDAVVGVVARRLPAEPPYSGHPFVDVVSTSGSTLRVVPWTRLSGEVFGDVSGVERCRALVRLVVARCPTAHIDRATREHLAGAEPLQLPDAAMLAEHDERIA